MLDINDKNLLFYDIEVFSNDSFVVFKDINKRLVRCFRNSFEGLDKVIEDKVLVGFNNYFYDDKILSGMLRGMSTTGLKKLNDSIITGSNNFDIKIDDRLTTLDTFQQISVSKSGLKKIEANLGKMILESSAPFDIDRPLTQKEFNEAFEYCCYDVDMVVEIWNLRKAAYFEPKLALLERLGNPRALKWNTTTISANMLVKKPVQRWVNHKVSDELLNIVPVEVKDLWNQVSYMNQKPKNKSCTVYEFDNDIVFAFGGLHSCRRGKKRFENVILSDVTGMYPSTVVNNRVLADATQLYDEIRHERMEIKHKDKTLSNALKLILNSVYGLLKNQYSTLFNPMAAVTVCILGQIVLYELGKRLSSIGSICQLNTDGVVYQSDTDEWQRICSEWETEFGYTLEHEFYDLWIQRDVNNYIAVEKGTGKIKTKGGDVGRYHDPKPFDNNSLRIVDIAIVGYLVKGVDVIDTLQNNLGRPELYQYVLQAGRTYEGTFEVVVEDEEIREVAEHQRVNRVFASKDEGILLMKKKVDGDRIGYNRFPDTPDNMFLWNDECSKLENFSEIIDLNWYYKLIKKKLEAWV